VPSISSKQEAGGVDEKYIKKRTQLHWKSNSYLLYLCNMPAAALNHVHMLNKVDVESWSNVPQLVSTI
jgi:hypothetical protein